MDSSAGRTSDASSGPESGATTVQRDSHIQSLKPPKVPAPQPSRAPSSSAAVRVMSLVVLAALTALFVFGGHAAYVACRDAIVAPAILSPDSDVILNGKLKLGEFAVERARIVAAIEGIDAEIAADDKGIAELQQLRAKLTRAVDFTSAVTMNREAGAAGQRDALRRQHDILAGMLQEQKELVDKARADLDAGIISRAEFARDEQTLSQFEVALAENERSTLQQEVDARENGFTQRALALPQDSPLTPELMVREDQRIHVELEEVHLQAAKHSKVAERAALAERMATIDDLSSQLKNRPVYRAVDKRLDVAFVPYTQLPGVQPGAPVYSCLWGLFFCRPVGSVSEVVAGEVILPDPWGTTERGQYAVLDLTDRDAARSKTLRVRGWQASPPARELAKLTSR